VASSTSAIAEVRSLGDRWLTLMIQAFRAMFLTEPGSADGAGAWRHPELLRQGLSLLPSTLADRQDVDGLFAFARSGLFLRAQADESAGLGNSQRGISPLETIDIALTQAVTFNRVPEMAAFTLARPVWADKLAERTPLAAMRAGDIVGARALADSRAPGQTACWYLVMAWEQHASGSHDAARELLTELLRKDLPELGARAGRRAVALLRHAADINEEAFCALQMQLLDENDRVDLCRELIKAGRYGLVPAVAESIRLADASRVSVLTQAAKAAAAAGHEDAARLAAARAADGLARPQSDQDKLAKNLAQVAGAKAACGDNETADAAFARAVAVAESLPDPSSARSTIAVELAGAGRLEQCEQIITDLDSYDLGEALEALATAQVQAGQIEVAVRTLERLDLPSYPDRHRAVRRIGLALVAAGEPGTAAELAHRVLRPDEQAGALSAIAREAGRSGDADAALRIARSIAQPSWRASTLAWLCTASACGADVAEEAREMALAAKDADGQAQLLAEVAVAQPEPQRQSMFDEALRLAGLAGHHDRWITLAEIGIAQHAAGSPAAAGTFELARRAIRDAESDPWFLTDELRRLGLAQDEAGDAAGARDTFADLLREPAPEPERGLRPVALAGAAAIQAGAGDFDGARVTLRLARRRARGLRGEWLALARRAMAFAQVAIGDLDGATKTVSTLLKDALRAEDADDDEEGTLRNAAEHGVLAGLQVARQLANDGQPEQARKLLRKVDKASHLLLSPNLISELACAHVELGQYVRAAKVADRDSIGAAADRMAVVMAARQAEASDLSAALATAGQISGLRDRQRAWREIALTLAEQGHRDRAAAILVDGATQLSAGEGNDMVVLALIEIATAQASIGAEQSWPATLAQAHDLALSLDAQGQHDFLLSQIGVCSAELGDIRRACQVADDVALSAYRAGQVKFAAAKSAAALTEADDRAAAERIVDSIAHVWWRAAGLALLATTPAEDRRTRTREYLTEAYALVSQIPQGHERARLQAVIIEMMVGNGNYQDAIQMARSVVVEQNELIAQLADTLASKGAVDALKQLLPDSARFADAAYQACLALVWAEPAQAKRIVAEIDAAGQDGSGAHDTRSPW